MRPSHLLTTVAAVLFGGALPLAAFAQGGLTPAGAPAASMKRLDQVEPRTDLATLPGNASAVIVISQPGSYYLTGNVQGVASKHGILVASPDVTIDLQGFAVLGNAASLNGIHSTDQRIVVRNGRVSNWNNGLELGAFCTVEQILSASNRGNGIQLAGVSTIQGCKAFNNSGKGFQLAEMTTVSDCLAFSNGGVGFESGDGCTLLRCATRQNTGIGFNLGLAASVQACTSISDNSGFIVKAGSNLRDCSARHSTVFGFSGPEGDCSFAHCVAVGNYSPNSIGIDASSGSTLTACSASNWPVGIRTGSVCTLTACTARANTDFGIAVAASNTINQCAVNGSGIAINAAISSTVTGCTVQGSGKGIYGDSGLVVTGNSVRSTTANGIELGVGNIIHGNAVYGASGSGIYANYSNIFSGNNATFNRTAGIGMSTSNIATGNLASYSGDAQTSATGIYSYGGCRLEGNHAVFNRSYGIYSAGTYGGGYPDYILHNSCSSNGGQILSYANTSYHPNNGPSFGVLADPGAANVGPASNY